MAASVAGDAAEQAIDAGHGTIAATAAGEAAGEGAVRAEAAGTRDGRAAGSGGHLSVLAPACDNLCRVACNTRMHVSSAKPGDTFSAMSQ